MTSLQEGCSASRQFNLSFQSSPAVQWLDLATDGSVVLLSPVFCRDLIFILLEIGKEKPFFSMYQGLA